MLWILFLLFLPIILNLHIAWPRIKHESTLVGVLVLLSMTFLFSPLSLIGIIPDACFLYFTYLTIWIKLSRTMNKGWIQYRYAVIGIMVIIILLPIQAFYGGMSGSWYAFQDFYNTKKIKMEKGYCVVTKVEHSNFNYSGTVNIYIKKYLVFFPIIETEYKTISMGVYRSPSLPKIMISDEKQIKIIPNAEKVVGEY